MSDGRLKGSVERTGEGDFETIKLNLELDDEVRQQIEVDPEKTVQRFLESKGYKVNRIVLTDRSPEKIASSRWLHVRRPPDQESHYFQGPPDEV
ncbi:hypothetical protein [Streptomyces roseoverticillatus]|uniref:hypothetical protein n=1 Tax=Streptomyces roseoverticillatus TaxID=66429 RepID=UPI0012FEC044|nr:hypothetical protein [Streptomyces roseoverticillatus]